MILKFVKNNWVLLLILFIGLFFRTYRVVDYFTYGHEQDLQAWIVKDILIDHHPRLIGQETSITGLFIGPLYYYVLALFFAIFRYSPISSIFPITIISLITIASFYFVVSKFFGKVAGLTASFIYAVSLNIVFLDRWVVPTQTTLLWTIWFFYVVFSFIRGNIKPLPILIVLVALIWHIHIAFLPLLLLVPVAWLLNKKSFFKEIKKVEARKIMISFFVSFILLLPLVFFEMRHGYQQVSALTKSFSQEKGVIFGVYKLQIILENIVRVLKEYIFYNFPIKLPTIGIVPGFLILFFVVLLFLVKKNVVKFKEASMIVFWIVVVMLSHYFTKHAITEYYFNNLIIISVVVFSLLVTYLYNQRKIRGLIILLMISFFIFNLRQLLLKPVPRGEFVDKNAAVKFISENYIKNSFSCVGINYIGPLGVSYGYRYLFWKYNVKLVTPGNDVPVYSIVNPYLISEKEIAKNFGDIGVILPRNMKNIDKVCEDSSRKLIPLNGFTN